MSDHQALGADEEIRSRRRRQRSRHRLWARATARILLRRALSSIGRVRRRAYCEKPGMPTPGSTALTERNAGPAFEHALKLNGTNFAERSPGGKTFSSWRGRGAASRRREVADVGDPQERVCGVAAGERDRVCRDHVVSLRGAAELVATPRGDTGEAAQVARMVRDVAHLERVVGRARGAPALAEAEPHRERRRRAARRRAGRSGGGGRPRGGAARLAVTASAAGQYERRDGYRDEEQPGHRLDRAVCFGRPATEGGSTMSELFSRRASGCAR